ncbi:hypothetical protein QTJ16_005351 [Diplocarpon rosae]|uniref:Uncharacterized protein n=1 Tax=Diplocarpon rosae TaxID=946125 RepID=A0AAD9SXS8_9HELO|nr:hypothetical protein QTJ16_005351 [Diplocarpon rosae]
MDLWDDWSQELQKEALLRASRRWSFAVANLLLSRETVDRSAIQEAVHVAAAKKMM